MGKYENVSTLGLISQFISLIKRFFSQEKIFVKQAAERTVKMSLPGVILTIAALVFLLLSGIFLLVSAILILNIWFAPWASALIMTGSFMLIGLILGLIGLLKIKKGVAEAKGNLTQVKEDVRWLKKI